MKKFTSEFQEILGKDVYTIATCWVLTRTDGNKAGFTDHVENIVADGFIYHSGSALGSSSIENTMSIDTNSFEVSGVLDSDLILKTDLLSGIYDNSYIEMFVLDYIAPTLGKVLIKSGYLGEVRLRGESFIVEVHSILNKLNANVTVLYSPECRAEFCDAKCKFTNPPYVQGKVTSVKNNSTIFNEEMDMRDSLYSFGKLKFTTGVNQNDVVEVLECKGNTIILKRAFKKAIEIGDEFVLYAGCDKKFETCSKIYNNALNFRGEPHLVQMEEINGAA